MWIAWYDIIGHNLSDKKKEWEKDAAAIYGRDLRVWQGERVETSIIDGLTKLNINVDDACVNLGEIGQ